MAETFAEVPDGRHTVHTLRLLAHWLDPAYRRRPFLRGACGTPGWRGPLALVRVKPATAW